MMDLIDDGQLHEEAERIGIEKLGPHVAWLVDELELEYQEGAESLLLRALVSALMEGVRLGANHLTAGLDKQGIRVINHFDFDPPSDEDGVDFEWRRPDEPDADAADGE